MGGELKATFCLVKNGQAILSQHLGDLENAPTFDDYSQTLELYLRLFDHARAPVRRRRASRVSLAQVRGGSGGARADLALVEVQHHHAHIAACLAENGVPLDAAPVLGIALDGLGLGDDGTIWGGEFLLADYRGYRRLASLSASRHAGRRTGRARALAQHARPPSRPDELGRVRDAFRRHAAPRCPRGEARCAPSPA